MRKVLFATLLSALLLPIAALAQAWPSHPIKIIVPFGPGGTTDILARLMAEGMGRHLSQSIVVDNQAGATGIIGSEAVVRAPADGYTLGMATVTTHSVNPVTRKLRFDVKKDLTPVVNIANSPSVFAVRQGLPVKSMAELIALMKAEPGKYTFGSSGLGGAGHLTIELFQQLTQTKVLHVPYKGLGPAIQDALAGHLDMISDDLPSSLPYLKGGRLRALAVSGPKRAAALPDVPTYAEIGLRDLNLVNWFGLVAPAGTPPEIVARLNQAANQALAEPKIHEAILQLQVQPAGGTPQDFGDAMAKDMEIRRATAQRVKIELN